MHHKVIAILLGVLQEFLSIDSANPAKIAPYMDDGAIYIYIHIWHQCEGGSYLHCQWQSCLWRESTVNSEALPCFEEKWGKHTIALEKSFFLHMMQPLSPHAARKFLSDTPQPSRETLL